MDKLRRSLHNTLSWSSSHRPLFLEVRSSTLFINSAICTAIFTDIFLYAVIVPVFPFSLQTQVGIAEDDVQRWISILLAVYGAGLLVGAPICGVFADRCKYRKIPLLLGLLAVGASTAMICAARSIALLVIGRLLQGLAAAVIWVVGLALLADTVSKEEIATSLGYVGMAMSMGTLVGPLLGGIIYQRSGYYAVFAMSFGVIALDIILRLTLIEKKQARKWKEDFSSEHVLSDNLVPPPAEHAIEVGKATHPPLITETVPQRPRLPAMLTLWTSRRMLAAFWGDLVISTMMCGLDTTLTLFVSRTFGYNSLQAGLVFLALLVPIFFGPVFGYFVDKFGARWIAAGGFAIMVPPWILLRLVTHDSVNQVVLLCALLAIIGVGIAMALTGLMAEFSKICDEKEVKHPDAYPNGMYAQAYGIFNIAWAAGSLIGAFWAGGIYNTAGWGTMSWTMALLCGVTVIPVVLFTDGWIGNRKSRRP